MTAVIIIVSGRDLIIELGIEARRRNQLNSYIRLSRCFHSLFKSNKMERFSYKGGCGGCRRRTRISRARYRDV